MAVRPVGQDGPQPSLYEMTVSAWVEVVAVRPGLVAATKVVSQLVPEGEVAESAGLSGQTGQLRSLLCYGVPLWQNAGKKSIINLISDQCRGPVCSWLLRQ